MIGHEEVVRRCRLEALKPVPCQVLDGKQGAVGREDVVQIPDPNDCIVRRFDDVLQYPILCGTERLVAAVVAAWACKDVFVGTLHPIGSNGCIDGGLDVGSIKVDLCIFWKIVPSVNYTEDIKQVRAGVQNMIDVEARIDFQSRGEDVIKDVTTI